MVEIDYEKCLEIDNTRLDKNLMEQADLFYRVSKEFTLACSRRDEAYDKIKHVYSELSVNYRQDLENEGRKVTDKAVDNWVIDHPDYRKAVGNHLKLKKVADDAGALKESFLQRSYMLREMVQLYVAGYYLDDAVKGSQEKAKDYRAAMGRERMAAKRKPLSELRKQRAQNV